VDSQLHDMMDIEAVEYPETESDAYEDDDESSEQSDDSMATLRKTKRTLRREKCKKANKAKEALYIKFDLTVEEVKQAEGAEEGQDETYEGESKRIKRQKTNYDEPRVLRQATLNFDKVRKNRRLFSRKELQEAGQGQEETEEPEIVSPSLIPRASGKIFRYLER
jgi:hypothetical protein